MSTTTNKIIEQAKSAIVNGTKIGASVNLGRQITKLVRDFAGAHYPEAFNSPLFKQVEPLLVAFIVQAATTAYPNVPGAQKANKVAGLAMVGEAALLTQELMSKVDVSTLFQRVAALAPTE